MPQFELRFYAPLYTKRGIWRGSSWPISWPALKKYLLQTSRGGGPKPLSRYEVWNYTKQIRKQTKLQMDLKQGNESWISRRTKTLRHNTAEHASKLLLGHGSLSIVSTPCSCWWRSQKSIMGLYLFELEFLMDDNSYGTNDCSCTKPVEL